MADYTKMTDADFDRLLEKRVSNMTASEILSYGDVNMFFREELNNEILTDWEEENPDLAYPEDIED